MNATSRVPTFQPALNSTVVVSLKSKEQVQRYELPVDDYGETSFQFLPDFADIAFQGYKSGYPPSNTVVLSDHFVSLAVVDSLLVYDLPSLITSAVLAFACGRRDGKLTILVIVFIMSLFFFVGVFSLYSRFFQYTVWGCPNDIISGFITFDLLKSIYYSTVLLSGAFLSCWVVFMFALKKKNPFLVKAESWMPAS